jgi:hypothetical protein
MAKKTLVRLFHKLIPVAALVALAAAAIMPGLTVPEAVAASPASWTPDRLVAPDAYSPAMATDSSGHLWMAAQCTYEISLMESTDKGATWTEISSTSTDYDLWHPDIAIDPYTDKVYVVYERAFTYMDFDILYGIYTPGEGAVWGLVIDSDSDFDHSPSITCEYQYGTYNYLYVSYTYRNTTDDQDLMLAKSTDHGGTWVTTKLHGDSDSDAYLDSDITNADGRIYLAYSHSTDYGDIWVDWSANWGSTWTQVRVVDNSPRRVYFPSVAATHGGGTVMVAYRYAYSSSDYDVQYAYSTDSGGTWSAYNALANDSSSMEDRPSLTVDGWGFTSNTIYGKIHAVYIKDDSVYYRSADYSTPTAWSSAERVGDPGTAQDDCPIAVTTQLRRGVWYPCVAFYDFRSAQGNVYYSTMALDPAVTTSGATGIGTTSATLNGNLSDWGTAASVQLSFEWGTSASYGSETPPQSAWGTGTFSADLTSLLPNTTYHFRAKAVGDGTAHGGDVFFTTGTTPPTVTTSAATGVSTTAATLNGNLTSLGLASSVQVSFQWGLTDGYGNTTTPQTLTGTNTFSDGISGLTPGTTYHFRAVAVGDGTAYGGDMTFPTDIVPNQNPGQPSNTSPAAGATGVSLTPTLSSSAFSDPDVGDTHGASQWQMITSPWDYANPAFDSSTDTKNLTSITVPSGKLAYSTLYYWRVRHRDNHGAWSGWSLETSFTTVSSSGDTTPPAAVTDLAATEATSTTVTLTWTAPGDDGNTGTASTYDIRYSTETITDANWGPAIQCSDEPAPAAADAEHTFTVTGLSPDTTYYFAVKTADEVPNWSGLSNIASRKTEAAAPANQPPAQPTSVSPVTGSTGLTLMPTLQASAFADPDAGDTHGASQWQIDDTPWDYLSPVFDSATDTVNLTSITVPSGKLTYSTLYYWRVRYQDGLGAWSDWSVEMSFATVGAPADSTPPTTPTVADDGPTTTVTSSLHASWASTDPESGVAEFEYAIGTSAGGTDVVGWTSAGAASGVNRTGLSLTVGTTYYFSVKARNGAGLWSAVAVSDGIKVIDEGDTTPTPSDGDDNGLPFWIWIPIGLGIVTAAGIVIYFVRRRLRAS